jgi:hypothetical protein
MESMYGAQSTESAQPARSNAGSRRPSKQKRTDNCGKSVPHYQEGTLVQQVGAGRCGIGRDTWHVISATPVNLLHPAGGCESAAAQSIDYKGESWQGLWASATLSHNSCTRPHRSTAIIVLVMKARKYRHNRTGHDRNELRSLAGDQQVAGSNPANPARSCGPGCLRNPSQWTVAGCG